MASGGGSQIVNDVIINYASQNLDQTVGGVKQTSVALDGLVVSATSADKATTSIANKFSALEKVLGTSAGQQQIYEREQAKVNLALAQNPELAGRAAEATSALKAKYLSIGQAATDAGKAHEGFSTQAQALFHAIRGGVEQIAVGIPITQALTSEMNHLTYAATGKGGIGGAFGELGGFIKNLISPTTAAIAGVAGLTAAALALANAYDKVQVSSQRAIGGAGARTGTTTSDLNSFVDKNASVSTSGLSDKEVRNLGEELTATGEIVVSKLHGMSDAVLGFANQSHKSVADAIKEFAEFGKDPMKGVQALTDAFGPLDIETRKAVESALQMHDKTAALNIVIDALAEKSKNAAQNMSVLDKIWRGITTFAGKETVSPSGPEDQLRSAMEKAATAQDALSSAAEQAAPGPVLDALAENLAKATAEVDKFKAAVDKLKATSAGDALNQLSTEADNADRALIPQIAHMDALKTKIEELNRAKAGGTTSQYGSSVDDAALQAAQNQLQALKESQAAAARYNEQVAAVARSWGDVGQATALALDAAQTQLPVLQAVGGAARMAAQATADFTTYMRQGKTEAEAAALAASHLAASQAQATSAVKEQVHALEQSTDLIKAQMNGNERQVASAQAYDEAIRSGADASAAAAISNATNANYLARGAQEAEREAAAAQQAADAFERAARAAQGANLGRGGDFGNFRADGQLDNQDAGPQDSTGGNPGFNAVLLQQANDQKISIQQRVDAAYAAGGPAAALAAARGASNTSGADPMLAQLLAPQGYDLTKILGEQRSNVPDKISAIDSIIQLQNGQTTDKSVQAGNLQAEIAMLQSLPQSIARDQKITDLRSSIDSLIKSTDSNTSATGANTDALSPYYSQDPRTSHIGFRSQGMASGGEFTVPGGYSANDNMLGTIPLASGEIVSVRRPGQDSGSSQSNVVHMNVTISGNASKDEVKRTMLQVGQTMAKQLAAARQ